MFDPQVISEWSNKVLKYGDPFIDYQIAEKFVVDCLSAELIPSRVAIFCIERGIPLSLAVCEYQYYYYRRNRR